MDIKPVLKPNLSVQDVRIIVENIYKLNADCIEPLKSYCDQNFKIDCCIDGKSCYYNLKVLNNDDSKLPELLETEHKILFHLKSKNFKCPVPVQLEVAGQIQTYFYINENFDLFKSDFTALDATNVCQRLDKSSNYFILRLMEFVPGRTLYEAKCYTEKLLFKIGYYAASLDAALEGFYEPILETNSSTWHMDKIEKYEYKIEFIKNEVIKSRVWEIVREFKQTVFNKDTLKYLKKGVIHGDFNDENILVDCTVNLDCINGVIDFGDISLSYWIFELAICTLYMMIDASEAMSQNLNEIEVAAHVIGGYASRIPLSQIEFELLLICIKTRISQSLINSSYAFYLQPDNKYILKNQKNSWNLLCKLDSIKTEEIYRTWRSVLKTKYNIEP